jgi:hypothetical protein
VQRTPPVDLRLRSQTGDGCGFMCPSTAVGMDLVRAAPGGEDRRPGLAGLPVSGGGTATAGTSGPQLAARRSARLPARRQARRSGTSTACGVSRPPGSGRPQDCAPARSTSLRGRRPSPGGQLLWPCSLPGKHGCTSEATNHPPGRSIVVTVDKVPARSSMSISQLAGAAVERPPIRPSGAPGNVGAEVGDVLWAGGAFLVEHVG